MRMLYRDFNANDLRGSTVVEGSSRMCGGMY